MTVKITRREFLRRAGLGAGAMVLGCYISPEEKAFAFTKNIKDIFHEGIPLNNFVAILLNGTFIIMSPRSEMGQGIRSSLAAVLVDELEADWSRVRVQQADAEALRYAIPNPNPEGLPKYLIPEEVSQFADSSRSMALYFQPMRLFGAGIRLVFERAGGRHFKVDPGECKAEQHRVVHVPTGRSIDYRWLLLEARNVEVPTVPEIEAALKPPEKWNFIGKKMPFNDAHDMCNGKAVYGADVDLRGMLTAMVVHCPVANGTLKSFDDTAARKVPGVQGVVPIPFPGGVGGGFLPHAGVAVVAENTWAAWQGRRALKVEWNLGPNAAYESEGFRRVLEDVTSKPGKVVRSRGDVDSTLGIVGTTVEAEYYVPHLAQAPMEPPVTIARYENGRWEIWAPSQGPDFTQRYVGLALLEPDPVRWLLWQATELTEVRDCERDIARDFNEALARHFGVDEQGLFKMRDELKERIRDKFTVHVTLLGGGFGRKSKPDYSIEAAYLAQQFPGVPVRVQWTREDDIQFSYFHGVSHQTLKATLGAGGLPTAWLQRSAFPSFFATLFPPPLPGVPELFQKARASFHHGGEYPYPSAIERAQGLEDLPFDVENLRIESCPADSHIRTGWMRSVSNIQHAFSAGCFADELARAAGRDSKDYLLEMIGEGRILDLEGEGVDCFDNNGFPAFRWLGTPPALPPYPPDTRRLRGVIERVAREARWDEKVAEYQGIPGRGLGIAAHRSFLSYVAIVADVSLDAEGVLTIHEIHGAIDCGIVVNPDRVQAQMEGGIVFGLSIALLGEITVKNGAVEQHNFDDYPVLRIHQTPKIYVHLMGSTEAPTGAGEPPTPAVAPAVANAIVAAGGPRIRELPLWKKVVVR